MGQTDGLSADSIARAANSSRVEQPLDGTAIRATGPDQSSSFNAAAYGHWSNDQRQARLTEIEQQLADSTNPMEQSKAYDEKALLLLAEQQYAAAIEAWDQGLALDPSQAQSWYNRGIALDRQGSHELALASYDRVIKLQPKNHIAWGNRAIALRKLGRPQEATEAAKQAFELNPEDMVDSFFNQLRSKQPKLAFVLGPIQSLVTRLRDA